MVLLVEVAQRDRVGEQLVEGLGTARHVSSASAIGIGTTVRNAWISRARCPKSGAALRTTFAVLALFMFNSEGR